MIVVEKNNEEKVEKEQPSDEPKKEQKSEGSRKKEDTQQKEINKSNSRGGELVVVNDKNDQENVEKQEKTGQSNEEMNDEISRINEDSVATNKIPEKVAFQLKQIDKEHTDLLDDVHSLQTKGFQTKVSKFEWIKMVNNYIDGKKKVFCRTMQKIVKVPC